MSVELKKLTPACKLGLVAVSFLLIGATPAHCKAKPKVRQAKALTTTDSTNPGGIAASAGNGLPRWVQYDNGGMYYLNRGEVEKARNYFLSALREAESVVPKERATGLKDTTVLYTCNLLNHLKLFVTDARLHGKAEANSLSPAAYNNPQRYQYDVYAASLRQIRRDSEWLDRVEAFANRALGKEHRCLYEINGVRKQLDIANQNTKFSMSQLEQVLKMSQSSIDRRPLTGAAPGAQVGPNGEYLQPGTITPGGSSNNNEQ